MCSVCPMWLPVWLWPSPQCSPGSLQKNSDAGILCIAWAAESHDFPEPKSLRHYWCRIYRIPREGRMRFRMESQSQPSPAACLPPGPLVTRATLHKPCRGVAAPLPQPAGPLSSAYFCRDALVPSWRCHLVNPHAHRGAPNFHTGSLVNSTPAKFFLT